MEIAPSTESAYRHPSPHPCCQMGALGNLTLIQSQAFSQKLHKPGLEPTGFMSSCCLLKFPETGAVVKGSWLSPRCRSAWRTGMAAGDRSLGSTVR